MRIRLVAAGVSTATILVVAVTAHWVLTARPGTDATLATVAFGLACTFLGPMTLAAAYVAFGLGRGQLITRLARVPAIEELMKQGDSAADRVAVLERQVGELEQIIESEVQRGILLERRQRLSAEATTLLANLEAVESLLGQPAPVLDPATQRAVDSLRQRLDAERHGDLVIPVGKYGFVIDISALSLLPFGGVLGWYIRAWTRVVEGLASRIRR